MLYVPFDSGRMKLSINPTSSGIQIISRPRLRGRQIRSQKSSRFQ